jgi:hypothetical protein
MRISGRWGVPPSLRHARVSRAVVVLAVLVGGGGAVVGVTGAGAGTAVATTAPFSTVEDNPCTSEMVAITGNVHLLFAGNTSGSGTEQSHAEANLQGVTGIGVMTGAKYVAVDTSSHTLVFDTDLAPFHAKDEETALLVRQGETGTFFSGDDFYLHMLAHATVNANGTVTVDDMTFDTRCR